MVPKPEHWATTSHYKSFRRINLDAVEDRAWLGALIVGEGSIFTKKRGKSRQPAVSIKMCDRSAVAKAARLMGVSVIASGKVASTGRMTWSARASCARALQVMALVNPFLTSAKIEQARATVAAAREAGFKTRQEMREERKLRVLETVTKAPRICATQIRRRAGCDSQDCMKYLEELKKEGSVKGEMSGLVGRHGLRWFPTSDSNSVAPHVDGSRRVELPPPAILERPFFVGERILPNRNEETDRKGFRGKRGGPLILQELKYRAWLAALVVGEGTIYTWKEQKGGTLRPRLAIKMEDKEAINKAGFLMGIRTTAAGFSKSGRQFWSVQAVGGRAIEIIELLRPFLTPPKARQASRAILRARRDGFKSNREKYDDRKRKIEEYVRLRPGCSTRELASRTGISNRYRSFLEELEREGKLVRLDAGDTRRRKTLWLPAIP